MYGMQKCTKMAAPIATKSMLKQNLKGERHKRSELTRLGHRLLEIEVIMMSTQKLKLNTNKQMRFVFCSISSFRNNWRCRCQ